MTLDKRILDIMKRYMGMLVSKKVLTTMEEVEANTNETNLVAAPVVAELNDKLAGQPEFLYDASGKITGCGGGNFAGGALMREAVVERRTKETQIKLALNLDGGAYDHDHRRGDRRDGRKSI